MAGSKQNGGTAPNAANAMGRSSFSWNALTQWIRGSFNIFTPSNTDIVNSSDNSIQSSGSNPGNSPPYPLLDELPDGMLEPNTQETISGAYYGEGADAIQVKPMVGGKRKNKKTLKRKNKKSTLKNNKTSKKLKKLKKAKK
jgi:hypothetical protein